MTPDQQKPIGAFEKGTLYRKCVEAARYWVIENWLRRKELPETVTFYVYPSGPDACMDWGNPPGRDNDGIERPMRYKRVRVTLEIESEATP